MPAAGRWYSRDVAAIAAAPAGLGAVAPYFIDAQPPRPVRPRRLAARRPDGAALRNNHLVYASPGWRSRPSWPRHRLPVLDERRVRRRATAHPLPTPHPRSSPPPLGAGRRPNASPAAQPAAAGGAALAGGRRPAGDHPAGALRAAGAAAAGEMLTLLACWRCSTSPAPGAAARRCRSARRAVRGAAGRRRRAHRPALLRGRHHQPFIFLYLLQVAVASVLLRPVLHLGRRAERPASASSR
jgi:hypothetical protein